LDLLSTHVRFLGSYFPT
jgi:hypothetical protein